MLLTEAVYAHAVAMWQWWLEVSRILCRSAGACSRPTRARTVLARWRVHSFRSSRTFPRTSVLCAIEHGAGVAGQGVLRAGPRKKRYFRFKKRFFRFKLLFKHAILKKIYTPTVAQHNHVTTKWRIQALFSPFQQWSLGQKPKIMMARTLKQKSRIWVPWRPWTPHIVPSLSPFVFQLASVACCLFTTMAPRASSNRLCLASTSSLSSY